MHPTLLTTTQRLRYVVVKPGQWMLLLVCLNQSNRISIIKLIKKLILNMDIL